MHRRDLAAGIDLVLCAFRVRKMYAMQLNLLITTQALVSARHCRSGYILLDVSCSLGGRYDMSRSPRSAEAGAEVKGS